MKGNMKKFLLVVLVVACGVLSMSAAAVVEDAASAVKPIATAIQSSDAQTVPNSSGGLRRLAKPSCNDGTCRLECRDPSPCTSTVDTSSSFWDKSCCGQCELLAPEEGHCPSSSNPCATAPCTAGCTNLSPNTYRCECPADNACSGNGQCTPNESSDYTCTCTDPTKWGGDRCEDDVENNCDGITCSDRGTCEDLVGDYSCACTDPVTWGGKDCETNLSECTVEDQAVCGAGKPCRKADNNVVCDCPDPATTPCNTGLVCQFGINANYTCVPESAGICSNSQPGFPTECDTASDCGGTCFLGKEDGKACTADPDCEDTKRCTSGTKVGFECTDLGTNTVECPPIYTCEGGDFVGRECSSQSDCNKGKRVEGRCTGIKEAGNCEVYIPGSCQPDIATCDSIDHCEPNPCDNGGTCTDVGPTFECQCPPEFQGRTCNGADQPYQYDDTHTGRCGIQSDANPTSGNIVLQFFALGDFPYDEEFTTTASGNNDAKCGTDNSDDAPKNADTCTHGGKSFTCTSGCTYEGQEYMCWKNKIIPWMNNPLRPSSSAWIREAKPAFSVHVGDFLKGKGTGNSGRCNPNSFASRKNLFAGMINPLVTTGDNDWNECNGFADANNNVIQQMWRDNFARDDQFSDFTTDFPSYPLSTGYGERPTLERQFDYEENFFFLHNDVVVIGLNRPQGWNDLASVNAAFVKTQLEKMHMRDHNIFTLNEHACEAVKSIIIATHVPYPNEVRIEIEDYFKKCGRTLLDHVGPDDGTSITVLNIVGNGHTYCSKKTTTNALEMELMVGGEESSDAHLISVIADPSDPSKHYFHFERNNAVSVDCY